MLAKALRWLRGDGSRLAEWAAMVAEADHSLGGWAA